MALLFKIDQAQVKSVASVSGNLGAIMIVSLHNLTCQKLRDRFSQAKVN